MGGGHIPSALSILDIVWALYDKVLQAEDRFILSKGHGCLALYAVLEKKGIISPGQSYGKKDSILGGHPDRNKVPGVLASTGSLGHGLPMAVGMALAKKIKGESGRVYCLVGDGECNEGSIWESCLLAAHHKLDNLFVIADYNHSTDRAVNLELLTEKFSSFGFSAACVSGHSHLDIYNALDYRPARPVAVVAVTVKGFGCARMALPEWHHRHPNEAELAEILQELS